MKEALIQALQLRREQIRARWETLLRIEPLPTPLAYPDSLVHLFDHTFAEVLTGLKSAPSRAPEPRPGAGCDCNPMQVYFPALEQAMLEALVLTQAGHPGLTPDERTAGVNQLVNVLRRIARREYDVYSGLCQRARQEKE